MLLLASYLDTTHDAINTLPEAPVMSMALRLRALTTVRVRRPAVGR